VPDEGAPRAAAVVLAAGEARRFGGPKLVMPFGGSTIIECVISALAGAGAAPIVVVTGPGSEEVAAALEEYDVQVAINPDPAAGMASSVQVGVAALPEQSQRFIIALGDQPRIRAEDIQHLLDEQQSSGKGIAIPTHGGKRGHPVAFEGRHRAEILALGEDQTLRDVVHARPDDIVEVEFPSDAFVRDIDTREQYEDELRRSDQ
jgi:molybdenum cofactor cytidylyltransferase